METPRKADAKPGSTSRPDFSCARRNDFLSYHTYVRHNWWYLCTVKTVSFEKGVFNFLIVMPRPSFPFLHVGCGCVWPAVFLATLAWLFYPFYSSFRSVSVHFENRPLLRFWDNQAGFAGEPSFSWERLPRFALLYGEGLPSPSSMLTGRMSRRRLPAALRVICVLLGSSWW